MGLNPQQRHAQRIDSNNRMHLNCASIAYHGRNVVGSGRAQQMPPNRLQTVEEGIGVR